MEQTPDKNQLICNLFDLKARLNFAKDEKKKEELLAQIQEIREQLVQIEFDKLTTVNNEEESVMSNGKF